MIRLRADHSKRIRRAPLVTFSFDGEQIAGHAGESLLAALMRAGHLRLRNAPNSAGPRGGFCCMGLCQECVVRINGQTVEACRTAVGAGLEVVRV